MHYMYRITNTINQKVYIGQTNNPSLRWSQHKSSAKYNRGNQIITKALMKYGFDVFTFEVIATCLTQLDADATEEHLIRQYDSRNMQKGYNIAAGGNTTLRTPEMCLKLSDSLKKHYETHDGWLKGGTLSQEWKDNISKSSMGKKGTNIGKKFSNTWSINISKSLVGKDNKSKRRFSDEIEKEICILYEEKFYSTYKLGKQFNCQRSIIKSILQRNNVVIRKSNYTGHSNGKNIFSFEQEKEICKIYVSGIISIRKLSEQFNCGRTTIRDILLRHNVKL